MLIFGNRYEISLVSNSILILYSYRFDSEDIFDA
jgi:hypothetical protein